VTNAYKLYSPSGKYRIIDEQEFIKIAQDKVMHNDKLKQTYANREITKLVALKVYKLLNIKVFPVDTIKIETIKDEYTLKTIEIIEKDIEKLFFKNLEKEKKELEEEKKESQGEKKDYSDYLNGSKEAMIDILKNDLKYKDVDEERTLEEFIEQEVYFTSEISYKKNKIFVELSDNKFICDEKEKKIYKYKSTIIDTEGYKFKFKKTEVFELREAAINESKKLIDEHYNLPIRNSKIQKIIVRVDDNGTIVIFWPEIATADNYIISNDVIGEFDLAGETKTSMAFFDNCRSATAQELTIAKKVINSALKLQTYNVKHL
jgi:predicted transcriptional regulator